MTARWRLWDLVTGEELRRLEGHTGWILSVAFAPEGGLLASGGADGTVRLWDPATGHPQGLFARQGGHVVLWAAGRLVTARG